MLVGVIRIIHLFSTISNLSIIATLDFNSIKEVLFE